MGVGWSHVLGKAERKVFETKILGQGGIFGNLVYRTRIIGQSEDTVISTWSEIAQDKIMADLVRDLSDKKKNVYFKEGAINAAFKAELATFERAMQKNQDERFGHPNFVYADINGIKLVGRHADSEQDVWVMKINYRKLCSHSEYFSKSVTQQKKVDGDTGRSIIVLDADEFPEITIKALHDGYKNQDLYHHTAVASIQNRFIVFKAKEFRSVARDFSEVIMPMVRDGIDVDYMPVPANVALGRYPHKMDFLFGLYTAAARLEMHAVKLLIGKDIIQNMDAAKYPNVFDFATEHGDDNLIRGWADRVGAEIQNITFPMLAACGQKHLEVLLQSEALNLPEEDILYLLTLWRDISPDASDADVKELMKHIRLPFINMECASAQAAIRKGFIEEDLVKEIDEFQKDHSNQHLKLGESWEYQIRQNKWNKDNIRAEIRKTRASHLDSLNQPTTEHESDNDSLEEGELFEDLKGPPPAKPLLAAAQKARKQKEKAEMEQMAGSGGHLDAMNQPVKEHESDADSIDELDLFEESKGPPPAKPLLAAARKAREQREKAEQEKAEQEKENAEENGSEVPVPLEG